MNAGKVANAVVRRLEAATPVYDVSEHGYSPYVSLVDGRDLVVDAPFEGDARITPGVLEDLEAALRVLEDLEAALRVLEDLEAELRVLEDLEAELRVLEDLEAELRVRDDVGGWAW